MRETHDDVVLQVKEGNKGNKGKQVSLMRANVRRGSIRTPHPNLVPSLQIPIDV